MVKYILLILALFVVFIAGCTTNVEITNFNECVEAGNPVMESYPRQCNHEGKHFIEELSLGEKCQVIDGNWIEGFNECEHISKESCENLNGTYSECESACRNNPNAKFCTTECVQVCKFD